MQQLKYRLCHNVGPRHNSNYNSPQEIISCPDIITFDGIYYNVWEYREIIKSKLQGAILFVMWNYVGKDNSFDLGQRPEKYCDWGHLKALVENYGCILGSHSWTHRDMTQLTDDEIKKELELPKGIECKYFAYPYGNVNERVAKLTREAGYEDAFSVTQGNGLLFQRKRPYLNW